jgi:pyruvate dehydrogenase E2 component (dihydrolipoamide acetyltransferase)
MADIPMPRLSDSMELGTILKWLKADGDAVGRGDELVEIETDKANMTYESEGEGVLAIVAREGETLEVGALMARLGDAGANGAAPEAQREPEPEPEPEPAPAP